MRNGKLVVKGFGNRGRGPDKHSACIGIDEHDIPEALDLRVLIGMSVWLQGERGDERTTRLFDAICAAKPFAVGAVLSNSLIRFTPEHGKFHHAG